MAPVEDYAQPASDAELITRVRAGDRSAFGELYQRHAGAASSLARQFGRSAAEADDLVSEAFARVLDGLLNGNGPDTAFRAYLFTTLRNTAYDRTRKDRRLQFTDDIESHDVAVEGADPVIAELENGLVGKAFAGLPERWQAVLWHTQVEGQSATEVGVLLGMAPNAVSSLAFRAREGLREAYLQAHLAESAAEQCRFTIERLGAWTRGGLSKREKSQVEAHLAGCDRCTALAAELSEINSGLRGLLAPLLLGGAAAGYLATLGPVAPLVQVGALAGGSAAAGGPAGAAGGHAAGSHLAAGVAKAGGWGPVAAIAGAAAAGVVLVAAAVIALTGSKSPPAANNGGQVAAAVTGTATTAGPGAPATGTRGALPGPGGTSATVGGRPGPSAVTTSGGGPVTSPTTNATTPTAPTTATVAAGPNGGTSSSTAIPSTATPSTATPTGSTTPATASTTTGSATTPTTSTTAPTTTATTTTATNTTATTTTPTNTTPTGTSATSTSVTTSPPPPADLTVGEPTLSGVAAGAAATLHVVVTNQGGTASTQAQLLGIQAPAGVTVTAASAAPAAPALRSTSAFATAADPLTCRQTATEITCPVPTIGPGAALTVTVTLSIAVDAADGNLVTTLNGRPVPSGTLPLAVPSGFASAALRTAFPIGKGAVNRVALTATLRTGVVDAGPITVGGPDLTVVDVVGAAAGCSVGGGTLRCPSAAAVGGVSLDIAVAPTAAAGKLTLQATDQRGRTVALSGSPSVSAVGIGGYDSVIMLGPGHLLRAGSTDILTIRGRALNAGITNPGPISIPVALAPGITVVSQAGGLPTGCAAAGPTVLCSPVDGETPDFPLPVLVSSAATGPQTLGQVTLPAGTADLTDPTTPLTVDPTLGGYDSIDLTAADPLKAGTMGALTLTGTPGTGVEQPGPIKLARQLSSSLLITAAQGCDRTLDTFVCRPDGRGAVTGTLTVAVLPGAAAADAAVADAVLDGNRKMAVGGTRHFSARAPGEVISLTGPFGGTMAGAATLRCTDLKVVARSYCPGGLSPVDPSSATLIIPTGAKVVSAELTWAATAPATGPASTLDTVSVSVDGSRPLTVHGVRPADVGADTSGADPVSTGQMFARVAGTADQTLLAGIGPGAHTVSVAGLAAKTTAAGASPMGAWSITVLYSTDSDVTTTVTSSNYGQANSSGKNTATTTVITPTGTPVIALWQTVWAADPWAVKTLKVGDRVVSSDVTGRHSGLVDGFALLNPALPAGGLTGAITFTNGAAENVHPDGLWVGPTLVIRSAG